MISAGFILHRMESVNRNKPITGWADFYACGHKGLPARITLQQHSYRLGKMFKHDFFAATGLYVLDSPAQHDSPSGLPDVVLKVHRQQPLLGIPMSWLGRWLRGREQKILQKLIDIENVPNPICCWGKTGLIRNYIEGQSLEEKPAVDGYFFDQLSSLLGRLHNRNIIYMDLNKRGNILLGRDGKPYLFDFQIALYIPAVRGLEWILGPIRKALEKSDTYHLIKHKKRFRPELVASDEMAHDGSMGLSIRAHRMILRPYRKLRHWFIRHFIHRGLLDTNSPEKCSSEDYVGHYMNSLKPDTKEISGTIFDIKRYAIHDGPGIRTTIFFKGCPLRCQWCHNPESFSAKPQLMYRINRCIGCGRCMQSCPQQAIERRQDGKVAILWKKCDACGECTKICPSGALEIAGKRVSVDEVMGQIVKDTIFYDQSGGGVTFCGGEPLAQPEFLLELLKRCRQANIHTAVDTSCYVKRKIIDSILDMTDLFLCDIKHPDSAKHHEFTGVENTLILDNIEYLAKKARSVIVRIPVIPGFNDEPETIEAIGKLVCRMKNIHRIDLLPYNNGGRYKSERIGLPYYLEHVIEPDSQAMRRLADILEKMGFEVKIGG